MTILNRLYASGGPERVIYTLEVTDGTDVIRMTPGWEDVTAGIEGGSMVTFTAVGIDIGLPAKNEDGTQDITFSLSNITGEVSAYIRQRITSGTRMMVKLRIYTSDDLSAPARPADIFEVKGGSWSALQADITAGYFDILSTAWPRRVFTLNEFPGLRYFT